MPIVLYFQWKFHVKQKHVSQEKGKTENVTAWIIYYDVDEDVSDVSFIINRIEIKNYTAPFARELFQIQPLYLKSVFDINFWID